MAKVDVVMPKMGESVMEGTVLVWHKQPGDTVELDETLLEISTDKVDSEVPSPAAGVLVEVLTEEGDTVEVGTRIAVLETDVDAAQVSTPTEQPPAAAPAEAASAPAAQPTEAPAQTAAPAMASGETVNVVMPKMGESVMEGTVLVWHKQPGDEVELDETLLEISTDKVDSEVPSPAAGVLAEILVEEGDTVDVGAKIAVIATGKGAVVAPPSAPPTAEAAPAAIANAPNTPAPSGDGAATQPVSGTTFDIPRKTDDGQFFSPLVRSIAEKENISLEELQSLSGSGHDGRLTKADVLQYVETRGSAPAPAPPAAKPQPAPARPAAPALSGTPSTTASGDRVEIIQMDRMRQIIAEHMVRSKATSPHVTSFQEIDVTNLVTLREKRKAAFQQREGIKLTYTPFFVHAAVEALRDYPILNASVEGKQIIIKKDFHIGIAVALGTSGLIVPVLRNAGRMNVAGLAHAAADVAGRARSKKLNPDELQGGTFTVTNVGSLGSLMGTPVINQPQAAILATGAIKKRPMVMEVPGVGDTIAIRQMMYVSLSYDHRIIDGAAAAAFLQRYTEVVENIDPDAEL